MNRNGWTVAGLALAGAGLGSCGTTEGKVTADTPFAQVELEFKGKDPNKKMNIHSDSPGLQGEEICIEFFDENGNSAGGVRASIPSACVPVPSGANGFDASDCSEGGDDDADKPERIRAVPTDWFFFGGPLGTDPSATTLTYHMNVFGNRREDAYRTARGVLGDARTGFQGPMPSGVEIYDMVHTQVIGTDLVLTFADDDRWEDLRLDLNGRSGYRTLDDAVLLTRNGWHLACLTMPLADLQVGIGGTESLNVFSAALKNRGTDEVVLDGRWTVTGG